MAGEQSSSNSSSYYPNEAARVSQMVVTVVVFLVGVTLNGLVVWVLGLRRVRRGGVTGGETQGAGSFRVYVVNLALADLVLLLRTPLMLGYLAHQFSWPFGTSVCQLVMFLRCLGLYAGAFLLSAVALERCLCLLRPVWARLRRPRWVVPLVCAVLWIVAAALSIPYITVAGIIVWENRAQCMENVAGNGTTALIVLETAVGFLLPLVVFVSCNLAVIFFAKRADQGQLTPTSPVSSPTSPTGSVYTSQRLGRLYRILFLTMLLFLTCWVPYFIFRFLKALAISKGWNELKQRALTGGYASLFLVYIKSAVNPILYAFAARGLRRTVRDSLFSTIERIFNEDMSESLRRKSLRRRDSQF
ncbi:C3a anaphylatoxin chemotactic receptor [Astyanax mexicanus]|uniref:C3a anaphylatoxin chemotactic receptor-like n=1 Tax=Astyanax mexicanus TaxID=7994 RepID=A0A8B9HQ62_ASTMX|nr:C3a anaphylatoxin chemotactic receptor [Astyanax mexicanus]KAG9262180.1 C3a anaphylatoxin chemotactic receptor-like [Astyanax mexicanus]